MLRWVTLLGFLWILMMFSGLKEKNIFTQNIWVRVKPRQALFIIHNFVTVRLTVGVAAKCQQR